MTIARHLGFAFALLLSTQASAENTKLLRFPDISQTQISFVYGGDIYVVNREGGDATRLTSHGGQELYPKFSPDGNWIAFSAEYSGSRQVYVMPSSGGTPRQLTYYNDIGPMPVRGGTDYRVLDWTPDGKNIAVRMNRLAFDERAGKPYLVPFGGGMETPLAIPESGGGMFSPDGKEFVYTPIDRDFRSWKRYRGGRAQDVWTYDLMNNTSKRLTENNATDHQPMWVGNTIYFVSDRDHTLNIFAIPASGGEVNKLTQFKDFDVLWPSAGPDAIVFENGGSIHRLDVANNQVAEVPVRVIGDRVAAMPYYKNVVANIESMDLSPGGERVLFGARGEIFTVPAKNGEVRQISRTPGARDISASWSPDGKSIAYLSDASGEYEIYLRNQDGSGEPKRITNDGDVWRSPPIWSPDGKKLAFADRKNRLRYVLIERARVVDVDRSDDDDIAEYTWAPDSRWLAYAKVNDSQNSSIWIHAIETGINSQLTGDDTIDFSPKFDPQGRYLYFLSNRDYNLQFSAYEQNYLYVNATRIYAASLSANGAQLYQPKSDEVGAKAKIEDDKKSAQVADLQIDAKNFAERVVALKAPAGVYFNLNANDGGVFFVSAPANGSPELQYLALDADKPETVLTGVNLYSVSADGSKLLARRGNDYAVIDAKPGQDFDKAKLNLEKLELRIDPRIEWQQEFTDAWRILRDWFYEENVHGGIARWNQIRDRYASLVPHVASRADLDYLFHEVAGEANAGHVYVQSPPDENQSRRNSGLLGGEFEAQENGSFRVSKIFKGEPWNAANRAPLTEPGVNINLGDYVWAIDSVPTKSVSNMYQLLENKAERVVSLKVSSNADGSAAREVHVKTISNEQNLRYLEWVARNRELTHRLSNGRVGYIHLPNTAEDGNRELVKQLTAERGYEALIIDDRYNGGGFIPDRMIEVLSRRPLNYWKRRNLEPQATPQFNHNGPKAMLINGLAASGGDALPYYFRKQKLGKLIGTRTWGGLIGISGNPLLADGGGILAATFRFMDTEGKWAVENEGVAPDIEVIDRPELISAGQDPSIEKGVEVLLQELGASTKAKIVAPPAPSQF